MRRWLPRRKRLSKLNALKGTLGVLKTFRNTWYRWCTIIIRIAELRNYCRLRTRWRIGIRRKLGQVCGLRICSCLLEWTLILWMQWSQSRPKATAPKSWSCSKLCRRNLTTWTQFCSRFWERRPKMQTSSKSSVALNPRGRWSMQPAGSSKDPRWEWTMTIKSREISKVRWQLAIASSAHRTRGERPSRVASK